MYYQSTIKGAPRYRHRIDTEYWLLVQQLMNAGWYRIGQDRDPARKQWGFRAGHTMPSPSATSCGSKPRSPEERWITANDEITAMRRLLRELAK